MDKQHNDAELLHDDIYNQSPPVVASDHVVLVATVNAGPGNRTPTGNCRLLTTDPPTLAPFAV